MRLKQTQDQLEALETNAGLLEKLGIDAASSGPASISVYALPTLLVSRNVDGAIFIRELLDKLGASDFPSSEEEALSKIVDMMSCKAAIKAGDQLTARELSRFATRNEKRLNEQAAAHTEGQQHYACH